MSLHHVVISRHCGIGIEPNDFGEQRLAETVAGIVLPARRGPPLTGLRWHRRQQGGILDPCSTCGRWLIASCVKLSAASILETPVTKRGPKILCTTGNGTGPTWSNRAFCDAPVRRFPPVRQSQLQHQMQSSSGGMPGKSAGRTCRTRKSAHFLRRRFLMKSR